MYRAAFRRTRNDSKSDWQRHVHTSATPGRDGGVAREPGYDPPGGRGLLRYESPVQFTARVLKEDIEICGQHIPKKWTVLCMLGAANRDPKRFKDPNQLDLKRLNNQHLAFSAGPHALHWRPARAVRRTSRDPESGAALSKDEAHWPATGMGINVWSQRTKRSFGYSIDRSVKQSDRLYWISHIPEWLPARVSACTSDRDS